MDTSLQSKIIEALNRCQFLLNRITEGDYLALKNASKAVEEAQSLLRQVGFEPTPLQEVEVTEKVIKESQSLVKQVEVGSYPRKATLADVEAFVARCQRMIEDYYRQHFPNLRDVPVLKIDQGYRYFKIVKESGAYAFVDSKNGDILKPASWRIPAKHARGNIFDSRQGMGWMGPYGPAYLRG